MRRSSSVTTPAITWSFLNWCNTISERTATWRSHSCGDPMSDPITPTSKQPCRREDALAIVRRLRDSGHVAYFAGGCVRDELLGIPPKDYDVATDAPPARVRELFRSTQAVGAAFGVILVRQGKSVVEV